MPLVLSPALPLPLQHFPASPTEDWSNVSLVYQAGPSVWPVTLLTQFYIRADCKPLNNSGQVRW